MDRRWAGEGADVEAILAVFVSLVGGLVNHNPIVAVFRGDDGGEGVVAEERGVVAGGELEFFRVEDGDVGVEHDAA
jgi:hypothetical protein